MAIIVHNKWNLNYNDVKSTFFDRGLEEEFYILQSKGQIQVD